MIVQRLFWLDWARAIAISLVVLGHFYDLEGGVQFASFLYGFHMPLFFLLSGVTYKQRSLWETSKTLIYPFLFFQSIYIIWNVFLGLIHGGSFFHLLGYQLYRLARGVLGGGYMPAEMLWFLIALLWDRILMHFIVKYKISGYLIGFMLLTALLLMKYVPYNPLYIKTAILSFPFFAAGYKAKYYLSKPKKRALALIVGGLLMIILFFSTQQNGMIYMNLHDYGKYIILFFINGFVGCLGILLICNSISVKSELIETISKATLFILCFHFWLVRYIRGILEYNSISYSTYILYSLFVTTLLVLIGAWLYKVTYKYLKVFYGKVK